MRKDSWSKCYFFWSLSQKRNEKIQEKFLKGFILLTTISRKALTGKKWGQEVGDAHQIISSQDTSNGRIWRQVYVWSLAHLFSHLKGWARFAKKLFSVWLESNVEIPMGLIKIKKRYFPSIYIAIMEIYSSINTVRIKDNIQW